MPFGQATLALIISVIALTGHFVGGSRVVVDSLSELFGKANFDISAALIDISENGAKFVVVNNTDQSVAVKEASCTLFLPIDKNRHLRDSLSKWTVGAEDRSAMAREWYTVAETIGPFLVGYEPEQPVVLSAGERGAMSAEVRHVSPDLETVASLGPNDRVTSGCFIGGVNEENEISAGGIILTPRDIYDFDLVSVLKHADYAPTMEAQRAELISQVEEIRRKLRQAERESETRIPHIVPSSR